jgi:sodium-dependent dicarboxylate transporter 2/3/5
MLPTATAPNAIIFASGQVSLPQMFWAGIGLNVIGVILLTVLLYAIGIPAFGISLDTLPSWAQP